jgi:hypothetical protein
MQASKSSMKHFVVLKYSLDQPDSEGRCAKPNQEVDRQQSVEDLRGDIHQQRNKAERPDTLQYLSPG